MPDKGCIVIRRSGTKAAINNAGGPFLARKIHEELAGADQAVEIV